MKCICLQPEMREMAALVPSHVDVYITPGSRETFSCVLLDGDAPVNLTNDTVVFTVKDKAGGTTILQKTNPPGTHYDAANGLTNFTILETDIVVSDNLSRDWVFEIRRINALSMEFVHIQGEFCVSAEVGV